MAAVLRPGAPLLVFGSRAEGIATAASRLRAAPIAPAPAGAALYDGVAYTPGGDAAAVGVVRATCAGSAGASYAPAAWEEATTLDLGGGTAPLPWVTLPGLFAGGGLDVMTTALLAALPPPPPRARVLDFCSGSGSIAAALRAGSGGGALRLHLLDADAVALHAARRNVADAKAHVLSDGFAALPRRPRFDWIVSNPPVHNGLQTDFKVLRLLVRGAARRLRSGGELFVVVQTYVPLGAMLAAQPKLEDVRTLSDDGRFSVWAARKKAKGGGAGKAKAKAGKRKRE